MYRYLTVTGTSGVRLTPPAPPRPPAAQLPALGMSRSELADLIGSTDVDWRDYLATPAVLRRHLSQPPVSSLDQRSIVADQIGEARREAAVLSGAVGAWWDHYSVPDAAGYTAWIDWLSTRSTLELYGHLLVAVEAHATAVEVYGRYPATAPFSGDTILPDQPPRHPRTFAARSRHTRWCRGCDLP